MALTEEEARELFDNLPDNLDCSDSRKRLLSVAELLKAVTDSDHSLSNADIRSLLAEKLGEEAVPAENTLNADIRALREHGVMGYRVHTDANGTWCESEAFSPASVRLCLNAVQSSRFVTQDQSGDVQDALCSLVSCWREDDLVGEVHVTQRARGGAEVLERCDAVAHALREGKKVEFEYAYHDFKGRQVALPGDNGETLRVETPIALIFSDGNYYLESYADPPWRHGGKVMRSRIDRMTLLRVSDTPAEDCSEVRKLRRTATRRINRDFSMFAGTPRTVFLRVMSRKVNEMIDQFGFGLKYGQFEGEAGVDTSTGIACVQVAESVTFFRWLAGTGGEVALVRPPASATAEKGPWSTKCKGRSLKDLEDDYDAMAKAYRVFLENAKKSCPGM